MLDLDLDLVPQASQLLPPPPLLPLSSDQWCHSLLRLLLVAIS